VQKGSGSFSRRELLKLFGITVGASILDQAARPRKIQAQSKKIAPRSSARNVIFVQNCGAMSPPDTLDFKETKYTAANLDMQKVHSDFYISRTLFPNYEKWAPRASLVRSMHESSLAHFSAQYHVQAGRALNPAIAREIPAFGSVIAMELHAKRRDSDTFPTFMSIDMWNLRCPQIGSGMLHPRFAGLDINTTSIFENLGWGDERWEALGRLSESDDQAFKLLSDARFRNVLAITDEEKSRYVGDDSGITNVGIEFLLARNIVAADAGARFIYVGHSFNGGNGSFDNHENLYGYGKGPSSTGAASLYITAPRLDRALSNLVQDLSAMPGHDDRKTLLDETMIVIAHEFGRNPQMNSAGGRDHWGNCFTQIYLGGGVKAGRVIGRTDQTCAKVIDTGWGFKEQIMKNHDTSTIYSALGIDYSKKIVDTPSGQPYAYQETASREGPAVIPLTDIEPLFG
jgi:hypothetical protein